MIYFGGILIALGLLMWTRGMIYTLWPQGKIAEKRKRKNLKYGFTTDMKLFGRKIRRLGFLLALFGLLAAAWIFSGQVEVELVEEATQVQANPETTVKSVALPENDKEPALGERTP
jgi:hypothetical protein